MTDVNQSDWVEADASNTSTPPNGWPSATMLPSQVEPAARAIRGALKRWHNQISPVLTSGGSANAQTLTHTVAHAAYVKGDIFSFIAGFTNNASTTLAVDALGALTVKYQGANLVGGEIVTGQIAVVAYDGTNIQLIARSGGIINPGFTTGSVVFQGATGLAQDNANLFYDSTTHNLGIGGNITAAAGAFTGNVNTAGAYQISGGNLASRQLNYNVFQDYSNNNALLLGGSGDPTNYYRNTNHTFQGIGGAGTFAAITSTGITSGGGLQSTTGIVVGTQMTFNQTIGTTPGGGQFRLCMDQASGSLIAISSLGHVTILASP